jgi:hypothetical protein
VQALVVDGKHALPPGQRLLSAEPCSIEAEVGGVTFEQGLALARIAEHRGNPLLVTTGEESGLDHLGDRIDAFAVDIVVAGHQQQPISVQCRAESGINAGQSCDSSQLLASLYSCCWPLNARSPVQTTKSGTSPAATSSLIRFAKWRRIGSASQLRPLLKWMSDRWSRRIGRELAGLDIRAHLIALDRSGQDS